VLDAVYLALEGAFTTGKLHEHHGRPIILGVESADAARGIALDAIVNDIVDG
jgi:hypothetical protein